uniref:FeS cluster biogenesis domain-containing protein n=1 Tax=Cavia porcellus TaxID=10141 RepID=A0A286XI91_CAVPO
ATVQAVSKRKLQPTCATLMRTPSAVNKMKHLPKDKPGHVGLKAVGCNSLSYPLEYTKTKGDSVKKLFKKAQPTLLGGEVHYVKDKLSNEFAFNNPNIKGTCGCGESF